MDGFGDKGDYVMKYYYITFNNGYRCDYIRWRNLNNAISFIKGIIPNHITNVIKKSKEQEIEVDADLVNVDVKDTEVVIDYKITNVKKYNLVKKIQEEVKIAGKPYIPYSETIERELIGENLELYEIGKLFDGKERVEGIYKCIGYVKLIQPEIRYKGDEDKFTIGFDIYHKEVTTINNEDTHMLYYKINTIRINVSVFEEIIECEDDEE
jgi:hypothetical protein